MKETNGHNITAVHQGLNRPRISLLGFTGPATAKNDQRSAAGESHEFRGLSLSQVQLAASRMLQLATGSCVPQTPE